ncbi:hypothetical protein [Mesorhizobium sp. M0244]|uniref:hypothetical protein n=1 Tax=Mesorhizobium sp. M0244 TaxID=2956926 RepID=UPI0033379D48
MAKFNAPGCGTTFFVDHLRGGLGQFDSRRRTVDGACGPSLRKSPLRDFSVAQTSAGMR